MGIETQHMIGPVPMDELSITEFAKAELAQHLLLGNVLAGKTNEERQQNLDSNARVRAPFYEAVGEDYTSDQLTLFTKGVLASNPELLAQVHRELASSANAAQINVVRFDSLNDFLIRLEEQKRRMAPDTRTERLRAAGLSTENVVLASEYVLRLGKSATITGLTASEYEGGA